VLPDLCRISACVALAASVIQFSLKRGIRLLQLTLFYGILQNEVLVLHAAIPCAQTWAIGTCHILQASYTTGLTEVLF